MRLIDTMTVAENQARRSPTTMTSPTCATNAEAFKSIEPKLGPWLCTTPENTKKGFVLSQPYWRDHLKDLTERWTAWKLA